MIVKCVETKVDKLKPEWQQAYKVHSNIEEIPLEIGQTYIVYGITFSGEYPWYLVRSGESYNYPAPTFFGFFEIVDSRIPPNWNFTVSGGNLGPIGLFPEKMAMDPNLYEYLLDEDEEALTYFEKLIADLRKWHQTDAI